MWEWQPAPATGVTLLVFQVVTSSKQESLKKNVEICFFKKPSFDSI